MYQDKSGNRGANMKSVRRDGKLFSSWLQEVFVLTASRGTQN
jgi:hypothetical protein